MPANESQPVEEKKPNFESMAKVGKERSGEVQKELEALRANLRERREKYLKPLAKAQAIREVEEEKVGKKKETLERPESLHKERLTNYEELLKENKTDKSVDVAKFAYSEVRDHGFNREAFYGKEGKGGWLKEFEQNKDKDQTLENYVLEKQYEELYTIRETLLEARVKDKLSVIYPELEKGEKKNAEDKEKEVSKSAKSFFKDNADNIEKFLAAKSPTERMNLRKPLFEDFKKGVFGDVKPEDAKANDAVNALFNELINDYQDMKNAMAATKKLNPKMVQMLLNNVSEDEWEEQLAKEAELEAKKLAEKEKVEKDVESVLKQPSPNSVDLGSAYYGGGLSASEKLGAGTEVRFEKMENGQYKVIFPADSTTGKSEESVFSVREEVKEGAKELRFAFGDPLMDKPAFVGEGKLKSQINGLYLEHIMHDSVKRDKDYLGPDLNDIIHDDEMYNIASMLFAPKKLSDAPINKEEAENFKKLMQLLANPSNNQPGKGIYGDMLAIRNRVSLMKTVLASSNDMPAKCSMALHGLGVAELKSFSVEAFCEQKLNVPKNDGNFSKN